MAHPYESSRADKVSRSRVGHLIGHKRGGAAHSDEKQDRALISKMLKQHESSESKVEGRARGGRLDKFARGGKVKRKADTQINIAVVQPPGDKSSSGAPAGGALLPPSGGLPPPPPPPPSAGPPPAPMGPMGAPPPMPMKPPGMMNRGGAVKGFKCGGKVSKMQAGGIPPRKIPPAVLGALARRKAAAAAAGPPVNVAEAQRRGALPIAPRGAMKRGGMVTGQKGGGDTGVGRLDKVKMQKKVR